MFSENKKEPQNGIAEPEIHTHHLSNCCLNNPFISVLQSQMSFLVKSHSSYSTNIYKSTVLAGAGLQDAYWSDDEDVS